MARVQSVLLQSVLLQSVLRQWFVLNHSEFSCQANFR